MRRIIVLLVCAWGALLLGSCSGQKARAAKTPPATRPEYVLVIHGGAGESTRSEADPQLKAHMEQLRAALALGKEHLAQGGTSLDAIEKVVRFLEDRPEFNAGKGAVYNHDGGHELDASIMDGRNLACGAVAGVRTIKNPISAARRVMEATPHVLLAGEGADRFAAEQGLATVAQEYFHTKNRYESLQRRLEKEKADKHGTVGAVALDRFGNLAAATSTGGMTNKKFGRVGDSPIIGAGTYADNRTCAISCTGHGEEFIRNSVAHEISALMAHGGLSLRQAAQRVVMETLGKGTGGVIGVSHTGEAVAIFNTGSMFRGIADSTGRFEVSVR